MKSHLNGLTATVALVALIVMAGCSSSRMALQSDGRYAAMTPDERLEMFKADTAAWHSATFAGKLSLKSPVKESASIRVYMVRDSLIQVSLRRYGIEGGIIRATTDSVILYSKTDNFLTSTSLQELLGGTPVTLGDLQAAILGRYAPGIAAAGRYELAKGDIYPAALDYDGRSRLLLKYSRRKPDSALPGLVEAEITLPDPRSPKLKLSVAISQMTESDATLRPPRWQPSPKAEVVAFESLVNFLTQSI